MIYDLETAREQILAACREMQEAKLIARTWGNVSARISEDAFLITPSGRGYDTMTEEDLTVVKLGTGRWEGKWKPSSEYAMHDWLYRRRPDCDFIIHTHQPWASSLSVLGEDLDLTALPEGRVTQEEREVLGPSVLCAQYGLSSTEKLARNVARAARKDPESKAVLMRCHGAVCLGADHEEAMEVARKLEKVCERVYEDRCGGIPPVFEGEPVGREWNGGYLLHSRTPFVMQMSWRGKAMLPYLDDMAQIIGTSIRCLGEVPTSQEVQKALKDRNAVLVRGDGALCFGKDPAEAEAVAVVLEKDCQAAYLAVNAGAKPLPGRMARKDRSVYLNAYSLLKDEE